MTTVIALIYGVWISLTIILWLLGAPGAIVGAMIGAPIGWTIGLVLIVGWYHLTEGRS